MSNRPALYKSLIEDNYDQGDPNILEIPAKSRAKFPWRYYLFVTDDSEYGRKSHPGSAFPAYVSNDLADWTTIGTSLKTSDDAARWAPNVSFCPQLERPFVMLYSRAQGSGDQAHIKHKIRRADSVEPGGPYIDSGEVLTEQLDFSIDPNVYRKGSKLTMAFATDFVDDLPIGTGLAEVEISDNLRLLQGPIKMVARAKANWQMYDAARHIPWKQIPGIDWANNNRVAWHCMEGPVGGLTGPSGRRFMLYSSGNYSHFYAAGILEELVDGSYVDLSTDPNKCFLAPRPSQSFYSVGRVGIVTGPGGELYVSYHARFGSPDAPRRFGLALLSWDEHGFPRCVDS